MKLNPKNIAIMAGISALTAGVIIYCVNNELLGLNKALGDSGWF